METDGPIITIEGGEVLANLEDRTITGRLIPYGEEGRTNVGRFTVEAGSVDISRPVADPSIVGLNIDHDRAEVVGRATRVWDQPDGIYASWAIANTPEGDAALADATSPDGHRRRLSAEFGPAVIRAGKLVAGHARLWGSSLVPMGAFSGAMVLASDTPEEETTPATEATTEGESTVTTTAPAEAQTPATEPAQVLATTPAPAGIPPTLAPSAPAGEVVQRDISLNQVLAAFVALKANPRDEDGRQVLAALSDIKISGNGALPTGANGTASIIQPTWVSQLYQGVEYVREYVTLGKLGTEITAEGKKGFTVHRRTADTGTTELAPTSSGGTWTGNKTAIPSHSGFTATKTSSLRRFARGNDLAREFFDLPGGAEVVAAFLRLLIEEYYIWSDLNANADWITAAGSPVAADTAAYDTDYPTAMGMVIQGILAVKARKTNTLRRDVPTFAILNEKAYEAMAYAVGGDQNLPAFLEFRVGTDGSGTAETVQLVQGDTGIDDTASVIVGARPSIEFDELPGGPLQIDALNLANGGVDRAVHGYLQTFEVRPEAVVLIGTADT